MPGSFLPPYSLEEKLAFGSFAAAGIGPGPPAWQASALSITPWHRGFLDSSGPQNSCDHLNALGDNQLPRDSQSVWKLHACTHQFQLGSWLSPIAFKWSQKIQCTEKGVRSLENLYAWHWLQLFHLCDYKTLFIRSLKTSDKSQIAATIWQIRWHNVYFYTVAIVTVFIRLDSKHEEVLGLRLDP